jgi:hypothetical protein
MLTVCVPMPRDDRLRVLYGRGGQARLRRSCGCRIRRRNRRPCLLSQHFPCRRAARTNWPVPLRRNCCPMGCALSGSLPGCPTRVTGVVGVSVDGSRLLPRQRASCRRTVRNRDCRVDLGRASLGTAGTRLSSRPVYQVSHRAPSHYRLRLLGRLDRDAFDTVVGAFLQASAGPQRGDSAVYGRWPSTGSSCAAQGRVTRGQCGCWLRWIMPGW